ncbi:MAG: hypothetical protein MJ137_08665, partial [Clostridia bacterium]|nr:hypothetical protein [Clostridia bacterium]
MKEILLNKDWYFHRGDIDTTPSNARGLPYINAKTERYHQGPASRLYVPTVDGHSYNRLYTADRWEKVELPHDYVIGDVTEEKNDRALGFVKYDNAWYRRRFTLPEEWRGKRITLLFHGVATRSTVYLNGCLAGRSFTGYCPFEVDISDICLFGEGKDNVLAVYVNTQEHEGWWYEGAGIYRDVYLRVYDPVSVDLWGVYVAPVRTENGWEAPVEVTVRNDSFRRRLVKVRTSVKDTDGISVAESETNCYIDASAVKPVITVLKFGNVKLWSPETPDMYICTAEVVSGEYSDEQKVRFGFREFSVDADKGLFINGKHYKIKGVCGHADCGLTGKAVPDNLHRYKVSLMKEMGANGYRCSHYPQAEALMDALDENGFIVMDETRWFDTSEEAVKQLKTLVKRDRNRPGVFFWSVGNEEPFQSEDRGRRIFRRLYEEVRKLDATRPILSAVDDPMHSEVFDDADVIGINYHLETYDRIHEKYP